MLLLQHSVFEKISPPDSFTYNQSNFPQHEFLVPDFIFRAKVFNLFMPWTPLRMDPFLEKMYVNAQIKYLDCITKKAKCICAQIQLFIKTCVI